MTSYNTPACLLAITSARKSHVTTSHYLHLCKRGLSCHLLTLQANQSQHPTRLSAENLKICNSHTHNTYCILNERRGLYKPVRMQWPLQSPLRSRDFAPSTPRQLGHSPCHLLSWPHHIAATQWHVLTTHGAAYLATKQKQMQHKNWLLHPWSHNLLLKALQSTLPAWLSNAVHQHTQ